MEKKNIVQRKLKVAEMCFDTENSMDRASKQEGSHKQIGNRKNTSTQNQVKSSEIPWIYNKERVLGKLNPHGE